MSRFPYAFGNHTIDNDDKDTFASNVYFDAANNYTFGVARKNGTTYISPVNTVGRTELKIGVLLPFHQHDNELTKMITLSGISAIRMAVAEINTKNLIPGAYITLIEQDSFPKELQGQSAISQAIFSAVSLIHEGIIAMIGDITSSWTSLSALMTGTLQIPQCSFSAVATSLSDKSQYAYFFRTIQTDLLFSDAALDFMLNQGWVNMGILYTEDDFGRQLAQDIMMKARSSGVTIRGYQSFNTQGPHLDVRSALDALMMSGVRIVYVAADNDAPLTAMIVAANAGYVNNDNVWLTIDMDVDALYHQVQRFNGYVHNITALPPLATFNSSSVATINGTSSSNATDNPILRLAQTTQNPTPIDFNTTFAGGIFNFIDTVKLPGYAPYDEFMQKWGALDPRLYDQKHEKRLSKPHDAQFLHFSISFSDMHTVASMT
ncbi:periplasmic binding protein-like I [Gongronella butleri]|nr:periplasmic binding protein-like I [Gongronella butleri]